MSTVTAERFRRVLDSFVAKPKYTLMRAFARFKTLRVLVPAMRACFSTSENQEGNSRIDTPASYFPDLDVKRMVRDLKSDGVAFGLRLPEGVIQSIRAYVDESLCFADRDNRLGFAVKDRAKAEEQIGKKVLVAQYFNTRQECPVIDRLAKDPVLTEVARLYLGSKPTFVGANLWWTFPVDASEEDRHRHAHKFHRDVDDFRFFKFFFYLTDVNEGDGGHVCVIGSQGRPPTNNILDRWNIRRYSDEEVYQTYPDHQIREITGKAGVGFAEDTWCIHKGKTPIREPRLLLQLQFALFDYGAMHDQRDSQVLQRIPC